MRRRIRAVILAAVIGLLAVLLPAAQVAAGPVAPNETDPIGVSDPGSVPPAVDGPAAQDHRDEMAEAARTGKPVELVELRTEGSDTYATGDGHLQTRSYSTPLNFKSSDGAWQPIDTTLVATDSGWAPSSTVRPAPRASSAATL